MKKILILLVFLSVCDLVKAQAIATESGGAIYLNKNEADVEEEGKRGYYVGPHILGDSITEMMNKFEKEYVYYVKTGGAYSTEEKKTIKYPIYKAVHRVNKYFEKNIKKDKIDASEIGEAKKELKMVLKKGIMLKDYYSTKVEEDLRKMKSPKEIIEYFEKIKFRSS